MKEHDARQPTTRLLLRGIPAFLLAAIISVGTSVWVEAIVRTLLTANTSSVPSTPVSDHPFVPLAGMIWTLLLALLTLMLFLRHRTSLFLASLAFINATLHLPETVRILYELFTFQTFPPGSEEGRALSLLPLHDPSALTAIVYFLTLFSVFLGVTVVHDLRVVPWKWGVALLCLSLLIPLRPILEGILAP